MAIFGTKTKKTVKKAAASRPAAEVKDSSGRLEGMLTAPWLSEKALIGTEKGVYVFAVPPRATKTDIKAAVEKVYKVVPRRVNIVNTVGKKKSLRTKRGFGTRAARTKAYVYLKKGETITFA
jgi:large subunit ribosomal protein L23